MADEEKKEVEQKKPARSKLWIIVGGVLVLVLAGGGAFVGFRYFRPAKADAAATTAQKKPEMKSTFDLDPFLVNLADTEGMRFVKVTFRLGLPEADLKEQLANDPVFLAATRDRIISLLSSKNSDQILSPEGKEQLRREVRERVNAVMPSGEVGEVYIVDFVVQL
jgi:flagellar FliL protein